MKWRMSSDHLILTTNGTQCLRYKRTPSLGAQTSSLIQRTRTLSGIKSPMKMKTQEEPKIKGIFVRVETIKETTDNIRVGLLPKETGDK